MVKRFLVAATLGCAALASPVSRGAAPAAMPVGAYLGNPNGSDEASFDAGYSSFAAALGAAPKLIVTYVDYTQPVSSWPANASWQAWSNAQSPMARGLLPVIGLPMASLAAGSPSTLAQLQAITAGQYDSAIAGVLTAWAQQGFASLVVRPGWEMNIEGPTFCGSTVASQNAWIRAFRHIYTLLHATAAAQGVSVSVVWNPNVTNYGPVHATTALYPGNPYVDVVAADMYADIYPFSDGGAQPSYHDWDTGAEDGSVAQFIADPVNRAHYWSYPAATEWSSDGSGGHSQSLASLIAFARAHRKPFAMAETGAGNSSAGTDVLDDAAFPQWLSAQLQQAQASGVAIAFVNIWNSNGGGNYEFSYPSDNKPQEAAAWAQYFGSGN